MNLTMHISNVTIHHATDSHNYIVCVNPRFSFLFKNQLNDFTSLSVKRKHIQHSIQLPWFLIARDDRFAFFYNYPISFLLLLIQKKIILPSNLLTPLLPFHKIAMGICLCNIASSITENRASIQKSMRTCAINY